MSSGIDDHSDTGSRCLTINTLNVSGGLLSVADPQRAGLTRYTNVGNIDIVVACGEVSASTRRPSLQVA